MSIKEEINKLKCIRSDKFSKKYEYFKKIEQIDKEIINLELQLEELYHHNNMCKSCEIEFDNKENKYCEDCMENDSCCDSMY